MLLNKAFLEVMFLILGIPISVLGVLTNLDSWKAAVLFIVGLSILATKAVYLIIEKEQKRRRTEMELEEQRHELNRKKKAMLN